MAQRQTTEQIVRAAIKDELSNGMQALIENAIAKQAITCQKQFTDTAVEMAKISTRAGIWFPLMSSMITGAVVGAILIAMRHFGG